jgi:hypothetical protein
MTSAARSATPGVARAYAPTVREIVAREKGERMESIGVLLGGIASVFEGMASTPLTTLASIGVAGLTLVVLNEFAKR